METKPASSGDYEDGYNSSNIEADELSYYVESQITEIDDDDDENKIPDVKHSMASFLKKKASRHLIKSITTGVNGETCRDQILQAKALYI